MKVDFRFTSEGDLELGSPSYNDFDELLYVDSVGNISTDSSEGLLIRDIPLQVSYLSEKQVILNRLRTDNPDWFIHKDIGADLSELIGLPNTRETGELGKSLIEKSLTSDKFILPSDLNVRPVPVSSSEILFYITVRRKAADLVMPVLFDLEHGLLSEYEVNS
ncbi:hypothetical protein COK00_12255 [Bacillus cereus]|uniref:hypothetical protein n=1 Tax=Bacillus cereus TaxID=1396 RepID=UPI000BF312E2|nr:hypothetical protein [Bacillus cereus]PFB64451.1 hypothetical protein CN291_17380 [Bacillus cereus]PFP65361.1 hypothetical protein COK00_12255 [Bacillus cereus]PGT10080.1 hypothetical protein COD03_20100 [Bacillus cereus]